MTILISINTRGLRSQDRRKTAFTLFQRNRWHIILLQETHWTVDMEMEIRQQWGGEVIFNHGTNSARGVAILFNPLFSHRIINIRRDNDGRILNVLLEFEDHLINTINIYAPSTDNERNTFFSDLDDYIMADHDNILVGDFNCTTNERLDKLGGNPNSRQFATRTLKNLCNKYHLTDIWRDRHKDERNYTWTGRHPLTMTFIRTRIDRFLTSRTLDHIITDTSIKPFAQSDHDYISITLNLDNIQRGPGYWHFNSDLIADQAFVMEIEEFWSGWKNKFKEFMDPLAWWEKAKQQFKTIAIRHAKLRGKLQRHKKTQLTRKLEKLQMKSTSGVTSDIEQYLLAKEEMKQLELKELEAIKIRAKAQYHEEGEASTRYFYSLEKARRADQTIRILTKENLDTVSNTQDLLNETQLLQDTIFCYTV